MLKPDFINFKDHALLNFNLIKHYGYDPAKYRLTKPFGIAGFQLDHIISGLSIPIADKSYWSFVEHIPVSNYGINIVLYGSVDPERGNINIAVASENDYHNIDFTNFYILFYGYIEEK